MLDFGMLPPEVNSASMYAGPGSGPMLAAAAAWDALTAQLDSFALGYSATITELQDAVWSGASSQAMVAAATPYAAWVTATATVAEQAASQARAAAAAYETAFAATVPPWVVTANRVQLAALVATNFFGQNTPMIAVNEAAYAQMWAQDAAAMYGYAAAAAATTQFTPFAEPPRTTSAATQSAQAAEPSGALAALESSTLSGVGAFDTLVRPLTIADQTWRTFGNAGNYILALIGTSKAAAPTPAPAAAAEFVPGPAGASGAVLASVGEAVPVGKLSVPASWPATPPAAGTAAPPPPAAHHRGLAPGRNVSNVRPLVPPGGIGPMHGMGQRRTGNLAYRMRDRRFQMPRPAVGG